MNARTISLGIALSVGVFTTPARGDELPAPELRAARRALASYEPLGDTPTVLRVLTEYVASADGADAREARFMRAVAATDLLLIARARGLDGVRSRVADALGVAESELMQVLRRELRELDVGVYSEVASDCRWALDSMDGEIPLEAMRTARGERRDLLFVAEVVDALGDPDDIARLAALGEDPCDGAPEECSVVGFSPLGRRSVGALHEAYAALDRLERVARDGEPLAASLEAMVMVDREVLRTSALHPTPALPASLGVPTVGARGEAAQPELLFVVGAHGIQYTHVPTVRVVDGEVRLDAVAEPALPAWGRIPFRDDGRSAVAPYAALVGRLRRLVDTHEDVRVGLGAASDVSSLAISRVILSMVRAGMRTPSLVSRGTDDEARSLSVALVMGEASRPPRQLFVRMGGFTLERAGERTEEIPRIRRDGHLCFDLGTLDQRVRAGGDAPVALRYMGVVEWGTVVDTAFRLRPRSGPLSLVLY